MKFLKNISLSFLPVKYFIGTISIFLFLGLSGDEQPAPPPVPSIEPSPRKKPRKQQLPPRETNPNVSPEWASVKREIGVRDRYALNMHLQMARLYVITKKLR